MVRVVHAESARAGVLAGAGWRVIAASVSKAAVDTFDGPPQVELHRPDVTNDAAVKEFFSNLDGVDGLVDCAGILQRGTGYDTDVFSKGH